MECGSLGWPGNRVSIRRRKTTDKTSQPATTKRGQARVLSTSAAARLNVTERTVRRTIARGDLPASKIGGVYRLLEKDVAALVARTQRNNLGATASPAATCRSNCWPNMRE